MKLRTHKRIKRRRMWAIEKVYTKEKAYFFKKMSTHLKKMLQVYITVVFHHPIEIDRTISKIMIFFNRTIKFSGFD